MEFYGRKARSGLTRAILHHGRHIKVCYLLDKLRISKVAKTERALKLSILKYEWLRKIAKIIFIWRIAVITFIKIVKTS